MFANTQCISFNINDNQGTVIINPTPGDTVAESNSVSLNTNISLDTPGDAEQKSVTPQQELDEDEPIYNAEPIPLEKGLPPKLMATPPGLSQKLPQSSSPNTSIKSTTNLSSSSHCLTNTGYLYLYLFSKCFAF